MPLLILQRRHPESFAESSDKQRVVGKARLGARFRDTFVSPEQLSREKKPLFADIAERRYADALDKVPLERADADIADGREVFGGDRLGKMLRDVKQHLVHIVPCDIRLRLTAIAVFKQREDRAEAHESCAL